MALYSWLKRLSTRTRHSRTKASRQLAFRPSLEALEDRLVLDTRIWTGGSLLSNHWSDIFNWKNGTPAPGDSVLFPADAKQRTNVVDIEHFDGPLVVLDNLHIEGGDYDIGGVTMVLSSLTSDAGSNTIHNKLPFMSIEAVTIHVGSGSLSLTGELRNAGGAVLDLTKTGAGTLALSNAFGDSFPTFVVQEGLVSMQAGGQLLVDLHIANGGTVRLQQGGDQITKETTIDSGGLMDLNGHSEGLGLLTLNGGHITAGTFGTLVVDGDVTTTPSGVSAVIDGRVDLGGTGATNRFFTVANGTAADDLLINGTIQGAAKLIKDGAGRLTLAGPSANTYTGLTQVRGGVLNLAKSDNVEAIVGTLLIGDSFGNDHAVRVRLSADEQISKNTEVRVNASGLLDLQGHLEGLGELILAGDVTTGTGLLRLLGDVTTENVPRMPTISGNLSLKDTRVFQVADAVTGTDLTVDAVIVDGALIKAGAGTMLLSGSSANTYTGSTTVNEGTLLLGKSSGNAVSGSLVIGNGVGGTDADKVVLQNANQIANFATTVNASGLLDLNNNNEQIGSLTLGGGHVTTGTGLLTLNGSVTAATAPTAATISGRLGLGSSARVFDVANSVSGTDLLIDAGIENGGLTKSGSGTMELAGTNSYSFTTSVNEGLLLVNGTLSNSAVQLNGGTLAGGGSVNGIFAAGGRIQPGERVGTLTSTSNVTLQAGASFQPQVIPVTGDPHDLLKVQGTVNLGGAGLAVQPLFVTSVTPSTPRVIDDGDAGFTATSGFAGGFTGGFGNDVHAAGAGTGAEQATWTFQGLTPGSYRVSATWSSSPFRTTNAPYTILNGATPVTTVRVNQQNAPADFNAQGADWDILGVVQVTGTSLTVRLTNDCDGAVIADAILLEPHQVVIIDNDGADAIAPFASLPEGAQFSVVATSGTQQQTQIYTISYRANDGNDVGLAYVTTATAAQNLQITPASINEGQKVTLTGHLTDPDAGDFLTLTINWGDGKTETHHPGTEAFDFKHRYRDNPPGQPHGAFTVHLTWFDQHGAGNSRDLTVTVNNVAPTVFLPADIDVRPGGLLVVAGRFTDPGVQDRWTATVNYGDGTGTPALKLNPDQHFVLQHRYQRPGTYRVTVTITDDDGESGTATLLVDVDSLGPHGGHKGHN